MSSVVAGASVSWTNAARADEPAPATEATIPVLIHAGDNLVTVDGMSCLRAACDGRVAPGIHHVTVQGMKNGEWVTELEEDIEIVAPAEIRVKRPGFFRRAAVATTVLGGTMAVAGIVIPLFACSSSSSSSRDVDPATGQVRGHSNPCKDLSTPVQVAWIGGIGVGITLALVGAFAMAMTSGTSHVTTRRWAVLPIVAPSRGQSGSTYGLGFVTTF